MTRYSALARSALFRAESVRGVPAHRGFPLPVAATAFSSPRLPPSVIARAFPRLTMLLLSKRHGSTPSFPFDRPGIHALRRSVLGGTVLPAIHRPILSQRSSPLRGFLPSSLDDVFAPSTLMGFLVAPDFSVTTIALQSVKELEGRLASFECCLPPWGYCPGSLPTEW